MPDVCTFRAGGLLFGLDVACVHEVLRAPAMTRVPLAPPPLRGLVNLRGRIVPALDLRLRLGLAGDAPLAAAVVAEGEDGPVALLVESVEEVRAAPGGEPPPETLRGIGRELIRSVHTIEDGLLLVLDPRRATTVGPPARTQEPP